MQGQRERDFLGHTQRGQGQSPRAPPPAEPTRGLCCGDGGASLDDSEILVGALVGQHFLLESGRDNKEPLALQSPAPVNHFGDFGLISSQRHLFSHANGCGPPVYQRVGHTELCVDFSW